MRSGNRESFGFLTRAVLSFAACVLTLCLSRDGVADDRSEQLKFFETRIRPVLHTRCVRCHGENRSESGLRLDTLEAIIAGGESGPAIVPGQAADSLLLEALRYESLEMPPERPLTAQQIADFEKWIAAGAVWPRVDGRDIRLTGAAFTEEERGFWSLQPVHRPPVPQMPAGALNEIDAFVFQRLAEAGLQPAQRARPQVLLRRLWFDVVGVPPSSRDIVENQNVLEPGHWEQLVDRLLSDRRFGEHWARHWLDVVRYAESDGFRADFYRPDAWRYRDYVVNAFNSDKPYNVFVMEQLAGDEIAPHSAEALVATGYLRTWLYEYNQRDARTQWQDILNQVTDVTGEAFLGLGIGCARCHDHKFDPILQQDYFRIQACFGSIIPRDDVPAADMSERQRYDRQYANWLAKAAELHKELDQLREKWRKKAAQGAIARFPEDIQAIMAKPASERSPLEHQLADLVNRQIEFDVGRQKISDEDKQRIEELEKQIENIAGKPPAELPSALTVSDVGPRDPMIHLGADPSRPVVGPGGLTILDPEEFSAHRLSDSTGRRTAMARWIASRDNPLTARVIVNRIWQQHFGTGLVATASDFGSLGDRPSHPELLDWLASELMAHNWSLKWLHRKILTSATWQMSSFHPSAEAAAEIDPGNRLRWRFDIRRLSAEQIRDAMLVASGELLSEFGGPSVDHKSLRRSLYLKALRNTPEPLLLSLDGVDGLNSVPRRNTTTTPTQALNLLNGTWVRTRAERAAGRLLDEYHGQSVEDLVDAAFLTMLARHPDDEERTSAVEFLSDAVSRAADSSVSGEGRLLPMITGADFVIKPDKGQGPLQAAADEERVMWPLTVVAAIRLDSLYADATVRTLISQWGGNDSPGWSLGVTSEKSKYRPRNLILQVVTDAGYQVVASDLRVPLGRPCLVSVTVQPADPAADSADAGQWVATFRLQPLDGAAAEADSGRAARTATVLFSGGPSSHAQFPVVIGGRTHHGQPDARHRWDGRVDQIALFDRALAEETLDLLFSGHLATPVLVQESPLALWDFNDADNRLADRMGRLHLSAIGQQSAVSPLEKALAHLCHVLMNSNEFVYLD